jgi:hypothetical protein
MDRRSSGIILLPVLIAGLLLPLALAGCPPEPVEPQAGSPDEAVEPCLRVEGRPPCVEDYLCPVDCPVDEPACQRLEVATALMRAEADQAERSTIYGPEHPDVQAGARVIAALTERNAELAAREWPLDAAALRLRLDRELAGENLALAAVAAQRLPQHPDLVARRARLDRLQQLLDALLAGTWP